MVLFQEVIVINEKEPHFYLTKLGKVLPLIMLIAILYLILTYAWHYLARI